VIVPEEEDVDPQRAKMDAFETCDAPGTDPAEVRLRDGDVPESGTAAVVPNPGTSWVAVRRVAPAGREIGPVDTYLARLAPSSRRVQLGALDTIARFLTSGALEARDLPWHQMTYEAAVAARAFLADSYAPSTANRHVAALRGVIRESWRLGLMTAEQRDRACDLAPIRGTRLPAGRALEPAEVSALLNACAADERPAGVRDGALIATLWCTGMRREELASLDLEDLSADRTSLQVTGKGNRQRACFLNPPAQRLLEGWLDVRGTCAGPLFHAITANGTIRRERQLTGAAIRSILQRRAAEAGIDQLGPHDLRRTFATELLDRTDVLTVQRLGGWADPRTVGRYDRRHDRHGREAVNDLVLP
jgi:integrase